MSEIKESIENAIRYLSDHPDEARYTDSQARATLGDTLLTVPVVVGQGTRLFPDGGPDIALDLVDSRATPKGVTIQVYRPTGRPQYATATADLKHVT
jgi:hypothetical protein